MKCWLAKLELLVISTQSRRTGQSAMGTPIAPTAPSIPDWSHWCCFYGSGSKLPLTTSQNPDCKLSTCRHVWRSRAAPLGWCGTHPLGSQRSTHSRRCLTQPRLSRIREGAPASCCTATRRAHSACLLKRALLCSSQRRHNYGERRASSSSTASAVLRRRRLP